MILLNNSSPPNSANITTTQAGSGLERRGVQMIMIAPTTAIILQWTFFGLAAAAALLRAINRFRTSNRPCPTDCVIILALAMFSAGVGLNTMQWTRGDWREGIPRPKEYYKMTFASFILFYTVLWTVKLTLISIYSALFPSTLTWLRLAVRMTWYLVLVSYFFCLAMNLFSCGSPSRNWDVEGGRQGMCHSYKGVAYISTLVAHLVTEILVFILPFILLHHLRSSLSTPDHIRVALVFLVGILGIVTTIVRIVCFIADSPPQVVTTWLSLEQATAIIMVCSPALKKSFMKAMHASIDVILDTIRANLMRTGSGADREGSLKTDTCSLVEILDLREKEMEEAELAEAEAAEAATQMEGNVPEVVVERWSSLSRPPGRAERWSHLARPAAVWNFTGVGRNSWRRGSHMSSAMSSTPGTIRIGIAC